MTISAQTKKKIDDEKEGENDSVILSFEVHSSLLFLSSLSLSRYTLYNSNPGP